MPLFLVYMLTIDCNTLSVQVEPSAPEELLSLKEKSKKRFMNRVVMGVMLTHQVKVMMRRILGVATHVATTSSVSTDSFPPHTSHHLNLKP